MLGRLTSNPAVRYVREAREELRKVTWPNQREVTVYSALVIVFCVVTAAYFGLLDWVLSTGLEALVRVTNAL